MIYWLGLGANLGDPAATFEKALGLLIDRDIHLFRLSSLYHSPPLGPQDQPDFTNAVAEVESVLEPLEMMRVTQTIERTLGRRKRARWRERELDLDLLLAKAEKRWICLQSTELTLPHPGLCKRAFVLMPLLELQADLCHPCGGRALKEYLVDAEIQQQRVTRIEEEQPWYRRNSVPLPSKA